MSEIKLCSYCKSVPQANTWTLHGISETRYFCPNPDCPHSVRTVALEQWNRRPIEDALTARIAKLEAENEKMKKRVTELAWTDHPTVLFDLKDRIAELKDFINQLIEAGESVAMEELNSYYSWRKLIDDWKEG